MKFTDRLLQQWRIAKAAPFIPRGARVLDIGSADGALFQKLGHLHEESMGIDPAFSVKTAAGSGVPALPSLSPGTGAVWKIKFVAGCFPKDMPAVEPFEVITMLATLEHFPSDQYESLGQGCARFLKPGGKLIITVPSAAVDGILKVLHWLKLIDGMSLEEHHGYDVSQTPVLFSEKLFVLVKHSRFQLGLNNLFVFERRSSP